jgi:hypothetical protein
MRPVQYEHGGNGPRHLLPVRPPWKVGVGLAERIVYAKDQMYITVGRAGKT